MRLTKTETYPTRGIALGSLGILVLAAVLALLSSPWKYAVQDRLNVNAAGTALHWTGTDDLGRDRTVRLSAALLLSLCGAVGASLIATLLAAGMGTGRGFCTVVCRQDDALRE